MYPLSRSYGKYGAIIIELLNILIIEHNHYSIVPEHSTYSAIMYYTSIVGARFGMHAHSVLVSQWISG